MFIQTELTPNPATVKFLPGQTIMEIGVAEFKSESETSDAPLAARLFGIDGVNNIFLGADFVAISKSDNAKWQELKPLILASLMEHLSTGQPVILPSYATNSEASEDDDEIVAQIKELIATRVRPAVMMDGGDIVFDSFEDGIVYLQMRGACSGCPSAAATLKDGVENMLKHFIPEVMEVRPIEG